MFVQFQQGKNGSPVAFIGRKVAFPPRGATVQVSEWWEVEIAGENPASTVKFLKLIDNFSAKMEIVANIDYGFTPVDPANHERAFPYRIPYAFIEREHIEDYQTWRFRLDHAKEHLIPVERIENERDRVTAHGKAILNTIKSLVPDEVAKELFITAATRPRDKGWECSMYGIYSTFNLEPETVASMSPSDCAEIVRSHLDTWQQTIVEKKAYYAAQPAYSGPDSGGLNYCHCFDEGDEW